MSHYDEAMIAADDEDEESSFDLVEMKEGAGNALNLFEPLQLDE